MLLKCQQHFKLSYFKRAPCAFRASVACGLFVLAGYADAARPRRPRSSWFSAVVADFAR